MNCANHVDAPAVAYCRTCGKPLCSVCSRDVRGVIYCEECLAAHVSGTVPTGASIVPPGVEPQPGTPNPRVAGILGWIPGVGAMYNGEYAKGFVHVLILGTLIWIVSNVGGGLAALVGISIGAFCIYMPIEAYKTAQARQLGLPAPDPLGFNALFGGSTPTRPPGAAVTPATNPGAASFALGAPNPPNPPYPPAADDEPHSRVPVGAYVLIGLGVLFLLDEMGALHFDWIWRFWPLILIAIGVRILMQRQRRGW